MQIAGDGDPLVFLHGAGTVTGFDALLPLAERFKLIVPFHPGFGPSADDTTVDDIHDYRRHYLDLFDELGLEEMALAGHSLGGWLAANFAADHTERVTRLVLAAPLGHARRGPSHDRLPRHPGRPAAALPDRRPVDLRGARADAADARSSWPIAIARPRRPRGSCGRAPTTSSCTAGCTA